MKKDYKNVKIRWEPYTVPKKIRISAYKPSFPYNSIVYSISGFSLHIFGPYI